MRGAADGTANQDLELLEGAASDLLECVAVEREVVFGGVGAGEGCAPAPRRSHPGSRAGVKAEGAHVGAAGPSFSECESRIVAPVPTVIVGERAPTSQARGSRRGAGPAHRQEQIAVNRLEDPSATARARIGGPRLAEETFEAP